ncbi:MAG: shikimate kinase, partial [Methanoregula sp.]
MKNIILIGMPGAGKSTMGVILAKTRGMKFIDTDIAIQETTGRLLQEIIDTDGPGAFKILEEKTILSLHCHNTVIATGGSVVFSERAMEYLKLRGIVVYLQISFDEMTKRLRNSEARGIV